MYKQIEARNMVTFFEISFSGCSSQLSYALDGPIFAHLLECNCGAIGGDFLDLAMGDK